MGQSVAALKSSADNPTISDYIRSSMVWLSRIAFWKGSGAKTFMLSKDLIEAFKHTDISFDLYMGDFKYPFDTFLIEGESGLFNTNTDRDTEAVVDCIMFSESKRLHEWEGNKPLMDLESGKLTTKLGCETSITAFFPDSTVGFQVITLNTNYDSSIGVAAANDINNKVIGHASDSDMKNMCNIFFNTMLYISDPSRNVKETQTTRSRKVKVNGKKVRSQYIYLTPPRSYKPLYESSGKALDVRFIVRGHWRNQAHGEGMKERKRIWIHPHWKGPEMSEIVSKTYKLKEIK